MAIKKKEEGISLPTRLMRLARKAFTLQAVKNIYADAYDGASDEIKAYLKSNDDDFDCSYGKGASIKTEEGIIKISLGKTYDVNRDMIEDLIKDKKITITSLLGAVNFNQEKLEAVLGSSYKDVVKITEKPDFTISLTADAGFKREVAEKVGDIVPKIEDQDEPAKPAPAPTKPSPKSKAAAVAKIKGKGKATKGTDEDLDDILKG